LLLPPQALSATAEQMVANSAALRLIPHHSPLVRNLDQFWNCSPRFIGVSRADDRYEADSCKDLLPTLR
jgi:hypothetical protein